MILDRIQLHKELVLKMPGLYVDPENLKYKPPKRIRGFLYDTGENIDEYDLQLTPLEWNQLQQRLYNYNQNFSHDTVDTWYLGDFVFIMKDIHTIYYAYVDVSELYTCIGFLRERYYNSNYNEHRPIQCGIANINRFSNELEEQLDVPQPVAILPDGTEIRHRRSTLRDPLYEFTRQQLPCMLYIPASRMSSVITGRLFELFRNPEVINDLYNVDENDVPPDQFRQLKEMKEEQREELLNVIKPYIVKIDLSHPIIERFDKIIHLKNEIKRKGEEKIEEWLGKQTLEDFKRTGFIIKKSKDKNKLYIFTTATGYKMTWINPILSNIVYDFCAIDDLNVDNNITPEDLILTKTIYLKKNEKELIDRSGFNYISYAKPITQHDDGTISLNRSLFV